jgi:accessory colonization factor AcfC
MRKALMIAISLLIVCSLASTVYAKGDPCESKFLGPILNECYPHHEKTVDTDTWRDEWDDEAGIGADILIHETKHADIVAEYKVDFNNDNHQSIYGVVRTKTSIVELVKKAIKKIKGEE